GDWQKPGVPYHARLWDRATGKELATLDGHEDIVFRVQFSPDGKTLATSSRDKTIRLWDVPSGKPRGTLTGHERPAKGMGFLPDGTLVTASWDATIRYWDVVALKEIKVVKAGMAMGSLDVSPDGTLLAAAQAADSGKGPSPLKIFDAATG